MFNPGQIHKNYQSPSFPFYKNSSHVVLDNLQNNTKSRWDQPIEICPVLYYKFNVPIPSSFKQPKTYPKSLLDYIKKGYERCKDESQKLIMERKLREMVRSFQNNLNDVNWENQPLPNLQEIGNPRASIIKPEQKGNNQINRSRLNEIKLPSSYNIVQQEKPSKALELAKKRMEKLNQKLNRDKEQQQQQRNEKQKFIGFSVAPPPKPHIYEINPSFISLPKTNICQVGVPMHKQVQSTAKSISSNEHTSTILKYQINDKPIQKIKLLERQRVKEEEEAKAKKRQKQKEKEKEKIKEKEKEKEKAKEKQKQKEKMKALEKQKLKQKQKEVKPTIQFEPNKEIKVSKNEMIIIEKSKQKDENLSQVARRFKDFHKFKIEKNQIDALQEADADIDFEEIIVGKNQSIEKPYLRITGRPNPDTVRPEPVLHKALQFFLEKYSKDRNYEYFISELRSVRQDLTVQHIKNSFTVRVYEENLQISLIQKDIPQFKHCQTTLWQLYCQGYFYKHETRNKFISHQMITLVLEQKSQQMQLMLTRVPESVLQNPQVQQCLKLKQHLMLGNYTAFFQFYNKKDNFVKALVQLYLDKMIVKFLLMICKTCGQKVPIKQLYKLVGEGSTKKLNEIIRSENGVIKDNNLMLKASYQQFLKSELLTIKKVTVLLG